MVATAVGLFLLLGLPVSSADAYSVSADSDMLTVRENRSVVVHVSEPGRHVLHTNTTTDASCHYCHGDDASESTTDSVQRFAVISPFVSVANVPVDVVDFLNSLEPTSPAELPEPPPPQSTSVSS